MARLRLGVCVCGNSLLCWQKCVKIKVLVVADKFALGGYKMVGLVRGAAALTIVLSVFCGGSVLSVQAATLSFPAAGQVSAEETAAENAADPLLLGTVSRSMHNPVGAPTEILLPESGSVSGPYTSAKSLFLSVFGRSPAMAFHGGLLTDDGSAGGAGRSVLHGAVATFGYVVMSLYLLIALFAMARTLAECSETGSRSVVQRVAGCLLCLFWLPMALLFLAIEQVRSREKTPLALRQSS